MKFDELNPFGIHARGNTHNEQEWGDDTYLTVEDLRAALHPAWHAEALCRGTMKQPGYVQFFIDTGENSRQQRAICARCPVQEKCRQDAIDHGDKHGVWGGTSPRQRRADRAKVSLEDTRERNRLAQQKRRALLAAIDTEDAA